jgi:hypothetical protein
VFTENLVVCVQRILNSVYLELGVVCSEHMEQCVLRIFTVCPKHLVQCVFSIWYGVYLDFGTLCT